MQKPVQYTYIHFTILFQIHIQYTRMEEVVILLEMLYIQMERRIKFEVGTQQRKRWNDLG